MNISKLIIFFLFFFAITNGANATTLNLGAEYSSNYKIAEPVYTPEPEISSELHEQCFKSCCIAKFLIKKDGKTSVALLSSSGSSEVDDITLTTLRRWKFKPATLDGQPIDSSRKIKVEFEVN
jgi:protein TonB